MSSGPSTHPAEEAPAGNAPGSLAAPVVENAAPPEVPRQGRHSQRQPVGSSEAPLGVRVTLPETPLAAEQPLPPPLGSAEGACAVAEAATPLEPARGRSWLPVGVRSLWSALQGSRDVATAPAAAAVPKQSHLGPICSALSPEWCGSGEVATEAQAFWDLGPEAKKARASPGYTNGAVDAAPPGVPLGGDNKVVGQVAGPVADQITGAPIEVPVGLTAAPTRQRSGISDPGLCTEQTPRKPAAATAAADPPEGSAGPSLAPTTPPKQEATAGGGRPVEGPRPVALGFEGERPSSPGLGANPVPRPSCQVR
jgi:hypothetical protein